MTFKVFFNPDPYPLGVSTGAAAVKLSACLLSCVCLSTPVLAAPDPPYYGPMRPWHGIAIAYKFGYRDRPQADGSWRVDVMLRSGNAENIAVYRAADIAREQGYEFIQFLGGQGSSHRSFFRFATVWFRLSHDATSPIGCRFKKPHTCYTASVPEVLRVLGGPDGREPGVAIADHLDRYGLEVQLEGYGAGNVTRPPPPAPAPIDTRTARRIASTAPVVAAQAPRQAIVDGAMREKWRRYFGALVADGVPRGEAKGLANQEVGPID